MDYMFLSERGIASKANENPEGMGDCVTLPVLKDFWHKSFWTYLVKS